jgi:hypothetical protein
MLVVSYASKHGMLPELCVLVDYDPDIGQVPEYWRPKGEVLSLARHLRTVACMDACEAIQNACIAGELPDVCEEAIRHIKIGEGA